MSDETEARQAYDDAFDVCWELERELWQAQDRLRQAKFKLKSVSNEKAVERKTV